MIFVLLLLVTAFASKTTFQLHHFEQDSLLKIQHFTTSMSLFHRLTHSAVLPEHLSKLTLKAAFEAFLMVGCHVNDDTVDYEILPAVCNGLMESLHTVGSKVSDLVPHCVKLLGVECGRELPRETLHEIRFKLPVACESGLNADVIRIPSSVSEPRGVVPFIIVVPTSGLGRVPARLEFEYGNGRIVQYRIDTMVVESTMRETVLVLRRDLDHGNWYFDCPRFTRRQFPNMLADRLLTRGSRVLVPHLLIYSPQ